MLVASFEVWSSSVMTAHCVAWDASSTASSPAARTIPSTGSAERGGARSFGRTGGIIPAGGSRRPPRTPIFRSGVRILAAAFTSALCALVLAGSAGAVGAIGVTEDAGKYSRDGGGPFFAQLADLGMNENAITIYWDPSLPGGMAEPGLLHRRLPYAAANPLPRRLPVYAKRPAQLSERGNDDPKAPSNASTSPVRFIQALGAASYASGRERPIMDALAYHPYPASSTDPISKGLPWPNAGVANLDRIKQAVWDAFHGNAQPTFENGLGLVISEIGWQVGVLAPSSSAYYGHENVAVTDEATQAAIYSELVRRLSCDPDVSDLLFLHLVDESDLSEIGRAHV